MSLQGMRIFESKLQTKQNNGTYLSRNWGEFGYKWAGAYKCGPYIGCQINFNEILTSKPHKCM